MMVNLDAPYNPYEDKTLTQTQPEPPPILESANEPFNDAIRYENLVAGRQRNCTTSGYPRAKDPWVRVSVISFLVLFVIGLLLGF